ncbi:MAG: CBS domain-containing protein [Thermaceae bacterium]|nr:CBS domain-containing protein [Thermaceae bacterium]
MLIKDVMHSPVLTVDETVSLEAAYAIMLQRNIRHIPVTREGQVVGMVTDRDIRLATSALARGGAKGLETPVREVMSHPVVSGDPLDPVEEAARVMRERKIGALPVMEGSQMVGIVTGIDLLEALLRLTGVHRPSGRLEVRLLDRPGELAGLTRLLAERGINIHSLLTYATDSDTLNAVVRVGTLDTHRLAAELRQSGFEVRWPPSKPLSHPEP